MSELSPVTVVGDNTQPYSGRAWMRQFPHGDFELLYRSNGKGPSEVERINAWLHDSGSDNRVTAAGVYGASVRVSETTEGEGTPSTETNEQRVIRRAKQKLRWLVKCLGADRLLTLTFRGQVTDYKQAEAVLTKFLRRCRDHWGPEFKFAAVPELQKRGVWHFHLALRGFWNVDKLRGFWWRSCGERVGFSTEGKPVLLDGGQTPGNVDITNPRVRGQVRRSWAIDKLAGYLSKYVGKAIGENDLGGSPSYRATRGLHPRVERYLVKALSFADVCQVFFDLSSVSVRPAYVFQSEDRQILWAAGKSAVQ